MTERMVKIVLSEGRLLDLQKPRARFEGWVTIPLDPPWGLSVDLTSDANVVVEGFFVGGRCLFSRRPLLPPVPGGEPSPWGVSAGLFHPKAQMPLHGPIAAEGTQVAVDLFHADCLAVFARVCAWGTVP